MGRIHGLFERYRQLDLCVALIVLVTTLLVSALCYASIRTDHQYSFPLLTNLQYGDSFSNIDTEGHCVGTIQTSLTTGRTPRLTSHGYINLEYQEHRFRNAFSVDAQFNALNQLVQSVFTLDSPVLKLHLSTSGVTPVTIELHLNVGGEEFTRSFPFPGPILLEHSQPNSASLMWATHRGNPLAFAGKKHANLESQFLDLNVEVHHTDQASMCEESSHYLSLTDSIEAIISQVKWLQLGESINKELEENDRT